MEEMKSRYLNASILLAGGACLAAFINVLVNAASLYESALPGWSFMCGLCTPILCIWVGLLLRLRFRTPRWWVQVLVLLAVLFFLYRFRHFLNYWFWWKSNPNLYLAMLGIGYLVPLGMLEEARRRKGWEYLVMLLLSVFCYTAVAVVNSRLHYMTQMPELQEMELLMERLANDAEPLLVILAAYFAFMFSFSGLGQLLGGKAWFRGLVAVPAVCTFVMTLGNAAFHRWGYFLIPLLVNPITVYLAVVLGRLIKRKRTGGNPGPWKDLFKL